MNKTNRIEKNTFHNSNQEKDDPLNKNGNLKLVQVKNLKTYFYTEEGVVKAVDGITFDIFKNEILGLVGETGCGKSVTALSLLKLVRAPGRIVEGKVLFNQKNLIDLNEKEIRKLRGKSITMIFQDPLNSLNPVFRIGKQLFEVYKLHQKNELKDELKKRKASYKNKVIELKELKNQYKNNKTEELKQKIAVVKQESKEFPNIKDIMKEKAISILEEVGIADAEEILKRYPHELSGGMRQRVMISLALACNPVLLIADEPTTALDVTIQAQILELMKKLQKKIKASILLITHDLAIVAETCDRVAVMYSGNIVEYSRANKLFKTPLHPYTKGLLAAIPDKKKRKEDLAIIRGMVPNLIYPPSGCRFHPRCDEMLVVCDKIKPELVDIEDDRFVACHLYNNKYKKSLKYEGDEIEEIESF